MRPGDSVGVSLVEGEDVRHTVALIIAYEGKSVVLAVPADTCPQQTPIESVSATGSRRIPVCYVTVPADSLQTLRGWRVGTPIAWPEER